MTLLSTGRRPFSSQAEKKPSSAATPSGLLNSVPVSRGPFQQGPRAIVSTSIPTRLTLRLLVDNTVTLGGEPYKLRVVLSHDLGSGRTLSGSELPRRVPGGCWCERKVSYVVRIGDRV